MHLSTWRGAFVREREREGGENNRTVTSLHQSESKNGEVPFLECRLKTNEQMKSNGHGRCLTLILVLQNRTVWDSKSRVVGVQGSEKRYGGFPGMVKLQYTRLSSARLPLGWCR